MDPEIDLTMIYWFIYSRPVAAENSFGNCEV